jgi:hypothetical protein
MGRLAVARGIYGVAAADGSTEPSRPAAGNHAVRDLEIPIVTRGQQFGRLPGGERPSFSSAKCRES